MPNTPEENLDEKLIAAQEFQKTQLASKLNWLRAGVLGANDGIMSTSGILMGVAGATTVSYTHLRAHETG
jgi:VIT1/CCC1 family predicted Fe2+/Mn2+ transporter